MPLSDIAAVVISTSGGSLSLPGFGTPLILGAYEKLWLERVRSYAALADVAVDFATASAEYLAAAALFSQNPRPPTVKIGRGSRRPTHVFRIRWTLSHLAKYEVKIGGLTATYTADGNTTDGEISAGLAAAITALGIPGVTAAVGVIGPVTHVDVTQTALTWLSIENLDPSRISIECVTADPGIAADLTDIAAEDPDWYALITSWNSKACILAAAAWVEANEKLYVVQTVDTECIAVAASGATDVMKAAMDAAYARTSIWYDHSNAPALDAGLLGRMLPLDAGSETWALKTVAGAVARRFTGTHLTNLKAKRGNWYYTVAGANITSADSGKVAANEWIDVVRGRDALKVDMQGRIFNRLRSATTKIPYTDAGATIVEAEIKASLKAYVDIGFISEGSTEVLVPKVAAQNPNDRAARYFPGITFTGTLAGAIHKLSISGVLAP